MWTLREKRAPSRLSPALITVNLQRHSHQKYHPGIFLFTSCRSSSVTFNLCKYLPFENLAFTQQITFSAHTAQQFLPASPRLVPPKESRGLLLLIPSPPFAVFPSWGPTPALGVSALPWQTRTLGARAVMATLLVVASVSGKTMRICPVELYDCH